jgi:hypothetical protein
MSALAGANMTNQLNHAYFGDPLHTVEDQAKIFFWGMAFSMAGKGISDAIGPKKPLYPDKLDQKQIKWPEEADDASLRPTKMTGPNQNPIPIDDGPKVLMLEKRVNLDGAKTSTKFFKFGGDEAVEHFGKHADQIMKVTGKSAYNLINYVDDANWIIQNGTYSSKLNGYYSFMANGSQGQSLFGFVGMKNGGSTISTFHIKSAAQLGLK